MSDDERVKLEGDMLKRTTHYSENEICISILEGTLLNEILERHLEFLKLEAKGFTLCEIVKVLSEKYHTSERNIYYDAESPISGNLYSFNFSNWTRPGLFLLTDMTISIEWQAFTSKHPVTQKPAYLSKMVDITDRLVELLGNTFERKARQVRKGRLKWKKN